jgi:uncharacterized membrane protein
MFKELRRLFIVGIFSTAPLALTAYILFQLANWFDNLFQPIVQKVLPNYTHAIPGLGIIIGIVFILLVGLLAPSIFGKQLLGLTERIVDRVPLAKLVYSSTKQIFDSFSQTGISKFSRVVLVRFPHPGTLSFGFVTQDISEGLIPGTQGRQLSVFVPTTPNPTSGYLIVVSESEAIPSQLSPEEALKLIISCGIVRGGFTHISKK